MARCKTCKKRFVAPGRCIYKKYKMHLWTTMLTCEYCDWNWFWQYETQIYYPQDDTDETDTEEDSFTLKVECSNTKQ